MGVHQHFDPARRRDLGAHRIEHRAREVEVEESVDEQRRVAVGDEAGVAPAPGSVRLEPREAPPPTRWRPFV
jgi:hypothetical protein